MNKKLVITSGVVLSVASGMALAQGKISGTEFNPAVSFILDGRYTEYDDHLAFELPGFMLGGEAGIPDRGFSTGHNEFAMSANIDDRFYGRMTTIIEEHDGETELHLEEAFFETLGLGGGVTLKGGKFLSSIGYLNDKHSHTYDFADTPLVYQAMVGGKLIDTGVQASWLAPTDFFLKLGVEHTKGESFPGAANGNGNNATALFAKVGGDFSESSSWQAGVSHYATRFDERTPGGHAHGHEGHGHEEEGEAEHGGEYAFEGGKVNLSAVDFVYKWAPGGNASERNFKFALEYFMRDEEGEIHAEHEGEEEMSTLDAEQEGFYVSAVYQFMPKWRAGIRYDFLSSDAKGSDEEVLEENELKTGNEPTSIALMVDYTHSEFSRLRFQINEVEYEKGESDNIYMLQYIMSLGAHGAHQF